MLVVDDGSTDDTARRSPARPARRVLRLPFNLGIGGAVQSGYLYALEHGYDVAVQVDGDGQHDARHIATCSRTCTRTRELDMVTGSRFLTGDEKLGYRSSAPRRARHPRLRAGCSRASSAAA